MRTSTRSGPQAVAATAAAALLALTLAACGTDGDGDGDSDASAASATSCESSVPPLEDAEPAAATEEATGETRRFEADNGTVEIPTDPQRIVATGYAVPVLLEADADLVGISTWSRGTDLMTEGDLATYEDLKKVAGDTADSTNYEAIVGARPDLIVLGVPLPVLGDVDMERLEEIAPVVVLGPSRPDDWKGLSRRQADAAGELDYYEEAKASYDAKAAELEEKYADVLEDECFGHVGGYGDVSAGNFHREYAGSWGTNIAGDIGVTYYGGPAEPGEGSALMSDYPSIEELPESLADATAITYTVADDGEPLEPVAYVLDHELWQTLPAVQDGMTIALPFTEAATYPSAERTLDEIDRALAEAFADELG
jgi:iron complex transport system substrate-binding protein